VPEPGAPPGYAELEQIAATTARAAAELVTATYGRPDPVGQKSSPTDVVTQTDLRTEELIRRHLREVTPEAGVLGEEGETTKPGARVQWVIDPLDGTVNFLYGVPLFAVSIAAALDGEGLVPGGPLPGGPVGACYYTASGTLESGTLTLVGRSLLTNRVPTLADSEDPGKSDRRADGREFNSTVNVKTGEVINWSLSTPGGTFKSDPASPALVMVARGGRTRP
jgi:Inositol monophosphatase family